MKKNKTLVCPILKSESLTLRYIKVRDAHETNEAFKDELALKYLLQDAAPTLDSLVLFLMKKIPDYETGKFFAWCIENRDTKEVVGFIFMDKFLKQEKAADIIFLGNETNPLFFEAMDTIDKYFLQSSYLHRIECKILSDSKTKTKLLEKLGYKYEGLLRDKVIIGKNYHDVKCYSLLSKDL